VILLILLTCLFIDLPVSRITQRLWLNCREIGCSLGQETTSYILGMIWNGSGSFRIFHVVHHCEIVR